jgi:hypothetical protein
MKVTRASFATAIFLAVLVLIYFIHVRYFKVDVVFYAALADAAVATILASFLLFGIKLFRALGAFEKAQLVIIWLLTGYALAISVPTVIDRSLSFYILEKLQQRGGGIKHDSMDQVFTQEYVKEYRLVDVRLTEQLQSGTIIIKDGCVLLTKKGEILANFGDFFRSHWLPKQRLLMGEYTDALTDPFRASSTEPGYKCKAGAGPSK